MRLWIALSEAKRKTDALRAAYKFASNVRHPSSRSIPPTPATRTTSNVPRIPEGSDIVAGSDPSSCAPLPAGPPTINISHLGWMAARVLPQAHAPPPTHKTRRTVLGLMTGGNVAGWSNNRPNSRFCASCLTRISWFSAQFQGRSHCDLAYQRISAKSGVECNMLDELE